MADSLIKLSPLLGKKKGKFDTYLDELWFEEVSETSVASGKLFRQDFIIPPVPIVVNFSEDFSAGTGSWDFSTGSMTVSSTADGGLDGDGYYLANTGATTYGVLSISSSLAYGTWEFDWWQSSVGTNSLRIYYISGTSNPLGIGAGSSTYHMFWNVGASAFAQQRNGGDLITPTENFRSSGFTTGNTWYRIKVIREADGLTSVYAKGGGFGSSFVLLEETSGSNPFTDNLITTSNFFSIVLRGNSAITNIISYTSE